MTRDEAPTIETPDGLSLEAVHHDAGNDASATVLLAHGITRHMDTEVYVRISDLLAEAGFHAVRFSFRGHGHSEGRPEGVTIAGERLDFESAFEHARTAFDGPYFVLAKSFGAVSTCLSLDALGEHLAGLVLWNPVLDVEGTFLEPTAPWGVRNFTGDKLRELEETGRLKIDGEFAIGRVLYDEFHRYDPGAAFVDSDVPALVVHGDADDIVPYEDARRVAEAASADFYTIEGGDHGFVTPGRPPTAPPEGFEHDVVTIDWLRAQVES